MAGIGAGLLISQTVLAQDAISFLNEANTQIRSAGSIIYQVVIAVLSIIAIVSLITVGLKLYSGDQESAQKALGWCGGMVFCIIAALVLKNFIGICGAGCIVIWTALSPCWVSRAGIFPLPGQALWELL